MYTKLVHGLEFTIQCFKIASNGTKSYKIGYFFLNLPTKMKPSLVPLHCTGTVVPIFLPPWVLTISYDVKSHFLLRSPIENHNITAIFAVWIGLMIQSDITEAISIMVRKLRLIKVLW